MRYLTIALTKGRLAYQTLELLEKVGITCDEMKNKDTRKLIFTDEEHKLRFFLAKGPDVPTYVEYGAAEIGIVGKDTILEDGDASTRYWTLATASAACVSADRSPRVSCCSTTSRSVWHEVPKHCQGLLLQPQAPDR